MLLAASLSLAPCSIDATAVAQQPSARIIETASGGSTLALAKILILRDGTYVASVESMTYPMEAPRPGWVSLWGTIHLSTDRGEHWSKVAKLDEIGRATLFEDGDALYFMGTSKSGGAVISRSTDHAATWSKPTSASTGMLHGQSVLEPCDGPAVRAGGRIWRAFTRELQPRWGPTFSMRSHGAGRASCRSTV